MREVAVVVYLVARIIAGEAGPNCGDLGREMIARSIVTRRVWWGESWRAIGEQYYGRGEPTEADRKLAAAVVTGRLLPNALPFVLSDGDVEKLGMDEPDMRIRCAGGGHLNLYRRWRVRVQAHSPACHHKKWAAICPR